MSHRINLKIALAAALIAVLLVACGSGVSGNDLGDASTNTEGKLSVVTTTTIVGDVVSHVAGDLVDQQTLMTPADNPHGFEPSPQDLTVLESADVVFINGLGLEEFLGEMVEGIAGSEKIVSLSENVDTIAFADEDEHEGEEHDEDEQEGEAHDHDEDEQEGEAHEHAGVDPHVWMDPNNITVWVDTVVDTLSELDPENAATYAANGLAYKQGLS